MRWPSLGEGHGDVILFGSDAVNAADGGNDDAIAALKQGAGGGMAHTVNLLVNRTVLFDVGVGTRDISLGLVIIVIADEIFDRVIREEGFEFAVELRGEGFVQRQYRRGALHLPDDMRRDEGLAEPVTPSKV